MTNRKEIPHFKRGKKLYFKRSELIGMIEEGRQSTLRELEEQVLNHIRSNRKKR